MHKNATQIVMFKFDPLLRLPQHEPEFAVIRVTKMVGVVVAASSCAVTPMAPGQIVYENAWQQLKAEMEMS